MNAMLICKDSSVSFETNNGNERLHSIDSSFVQIVAVFEETFDRLSIVEDSTRLVDQLRTFLLEPTADTSSLSDEHELKVSDERLIECSLARQRHQEETDRQLEQLRVTRAQLKDQWMEETVRMKVAQRYTQSWKNNHIEQWTAMLAIAEREQLDTVEQCKTQWQQMDQVHRSTLQVLNEQNQQLKSQIEHWSKFAPRRIERFDRELKELQRELRTIRQRRSSMLNEYRRMKSIIDEDRQIKRDKQLHFEQQQRRDDACRRIQAWWRGTIIRHVIRIKSNQRRKSLFN
jgi:hypothetical protein